jgi:2-desacetyl-2-hydroxyethyl bacteriochlorophyllide A dehydrogenase
MSGTIESTGEGAGEWKPGDRVTVRPLDPCGICPACLAGHSHICHKLKFIGIDSPGALQELWTVPAHTLHRLPDNLSLREAALIEPIAVACHDVRLGETAVGEFAAVIGGGPIGALVAMVAASRGARVLLSELNPYRLRAARELGIDAVDPLEVDLPALVEERTGGAGADVVFEVSGSAAGAETMTRLARTRGRIVVVAIYPEPARVDLFRFFWRELRLCGARVYQPWDFEAAIALAASGALPLKRMITMTTPLEGVADGLHAMEGGGDVMKVLVECGGGM